MKKETYRRMILVAAFAAAVFGWAAQSALAAAQYHGALQTTLPNGETVNANHYASKPLVYLTGGPQNLNAAGLPDGQYYFQVTDPNGSTLLSTDEAVCRQVVVSGGKFSGVVPAQDSTLVQCDHTLGTGVNPNNLSRPVQLGCRALGVNGCPSAGWFDTTPNNGGEYKAWLIAKPTGEGGPDLANCGSVAVAADGIAINFPNNCAKTDNFKVLEDEPPGCPAGIGIPDEEGVLHCYAEMPLRKLINGREITASDCSSAQPTEVDGIVTTRDTCTDPVIGSVDRVCTINTNVDPPTRTCVAENSEYLNIFEVDLFGTEGGQPADFPNPLFFPGIGLARLWIPPTEQPLAELGAHFTSCEMNIHPGWHLPDDGVYTSTDGGPLVPAAVYTPDDTLDGDRYRCWNFIVPEADTFEIFINNVPTGTILVTKETFFGEGVFNFTASGDGHCEIEVEGLPVCEPPEGFDGTFGLNTAGGNNPASTDPYIVDARINTAPPDTLPPPYAVSEQDPGSLWTQGTPSCSGDIQPDPLSNLGFGLAPGETVTCAFTNILRHCSYTQGAWFARPTGNNPSKTYLYSTAGLLFATGLAVGGPVNKLTFADAAAITATSPGGTPNQLSASFAYPPNKDFKTPKGGNLASQTVALTLNLGLTLKFPGIGGLELYDLPAPLTCYNGQKVSDVLKIANDVLGGAAIPCGTLGDLVGLLGGSLTGDGKTGINPSFDACVASQWALDHLR